MYRDEDLAAYKPLYATALAEPLLPSAAFLSFFYPTLLLESPKNVYAQVLHPLALVFLALKRFYLTFFKGKPLA